MSFVLDNSVAMCWLFNDGRPAHVTYALRTLNALKTTSAVVPGLWALKRKIESDPIFPPFFPGTKREKSSLTPFFPAPDALITSNFVC